MVIPNQYEPEKATATTVNVADQYDPAQSQAATGQATISEVKPYETVQGQMTGLLDSNSDYMQRAAAKGTSFANSRGLLNTSMGAGAAQAASIDAAFPIASQDADIFSKQRMQNQDSQNSMAQLNTQLQNVTNLANAGHMNDARKAFMDAQNQANQMNAQLGTQVDLSNSEWANKFGMSGLEQQQRLEQMSESQRYNLETLASQYGYDIGKMNQDVLHQLQMLDASTQSDLIKMAQNQGYNLETMTVQQLNDLQRIAVEQENSLQKMATEQGYTLEQFQQKFGQEVTMSLLNQQQIISRMGLEQEFNLEIQSQRELHEQKLALDKRLQDQLLQANELDAEAKFQTERLASAHHLKAMEIIHQQQQMERAHELGLISDAQKFEFEQTLTGIKEDGATKRAELSYELGLEQLDQADRELMHKLIDTATMRYESDMLRLMTDPSLNEDEALRDKLRIMKEANYYALIYASASLTGFEVDFDNWGVIDQTTDTTETTETTKSWMGTTLGALTNI